MKRFLQLIFLASILFISVKPVQLNAQMGWFWQNPTPTGETFNDVDFISNSMGNSVGNYGSIARSTNGGLTWSLQESGTYYDLNGVSFFDENNGIAVGLGGTILNTTNGGALWTKQVSGTTNDIRCIKFIDPNKVIIVGNSKTLLKSTDSGSSWVSQTTSGSITNYMGVAFSDANNGTIVGDSCLGILQTSDGGLNWNFNPVFIFQTNMFDVDYFGSTVFAVGDNTVIWNGGGGNTSSTSLGRSISSLDSTNGLIVGGGPGSIIKTSNSGANWSGQSQSVTSEILRNVSFVNENTGIVVGDRGTILKTINGGLNWISQAFDNNYWIDLSLIDENNAYIMGNLGGFHELYKTTDGGSVWTEIIGSMVGTGPRGRMDFLDANTGISINLLGSAMTTNGGQNWTSSFQFTGLINSIILTDVNTSIAVGDSGKIIRTTNGGVNWSEQSSGTNANLNKVTFSDVNTGTAVGDNGVILRSTNGGINWFSQSSGTSYSLYGVSFSDANIGAVVGAGGTILSTTNGGTNWAYQSATSVSMNSVSLVNNNIEFTVGESGSILKTINGGVLVQQINTLIPESFSLSQNYPNPFNPTTKIKFDLKKSGFVKIIVYDLLGREITSLVNDKLNAGIYQVDFNASNLSSGIYFYKMITEDFVETKKMVLMR